MPNDKNRIFCLSTTTLLLLCFSITCSSAVVQFSPRLEQRRSKLPALKPRVIFNEQQQQQQQDDNVGRILINANEAPVFIINATAAEAGGVQPPNFNCPAQVLQMPDEEIKINACNIQNQPFAHIGVSSTSAEAAAAQSPLVLRLVLATQYNINADVTALFRFEPSTNYLYYVGQNMREGKKAHIRLFLEGEMLNTPCVYANKLDVQFRCSPEEEQAEVQQEQLKNYFGTATADNNAPPPPSPTADEINQHNFEMPAAVSSADLHPQSSSFIVSSGEQEQSTTTPSSTVNPPARHVWVTSSDKKNFSSQSLFQPIVNVLLPEQTFNTASTTTTTPATTKAPRRVVVVEDNDMHLTTTTTTVKPFSSNNHTWTLADVAKRPYMKKYEALESRANGNNNAEIDLMSNAAMKLISEAFAFGYDNFGRPGRRSFR